jgi:hypothetical protein
VLSIFRNESLCALWATHEPRQGHGVVLVERRGRSAQVEGDGERETLDFLNRMENEDTHREQRISVDLPGILFFFSQYFMDHVFMWLLLVETAFRKPV